MKKEATTPKAGSCTTLDHVYPRSKFGTRCYCGQRVWGSKKNHPRTQENAGQPPQPAVDLPQSTSGTTDINISSGAQKHMAITLNLTGVSKNGKYAMYKGLRTVARLSVTDFPDSKPVESFTVEGNFAGPREAKPKLTKEERAELRKNAPKPTLAEKAAKLEARLAKLRAQAAAEANA